MVSSPFVFQTVKVLRRSIALPMTDSITFLVSGVDSSDATPDMDLHDVLKDSPRVASSLIHGINDAAHAEIAEISEHTSATADAVFLPCFTGIVLMPARASPSQSVISMRISRLINKQYHELGV
jgi:hypothetical protein